MARRFVVRDSVEIAVDALTAYQAVSDLTQMGRWSPENDGARLHRDVARPGASGAAAPAPSQATGELPARFSVGTTFDGFNHRGRAKWSTRCTVTRAEPGVVFAFRVQAIGLATPRIPGKIATWEYHFEPVSCASGQAGAGAVQATGHAAGVGGGAPRTLVSEVWIDDRRAWPAFAANAFDKLATGGQVFADFQAGNIARTLANLKQALENPA